MKLGTLLQQALEKARRLLAPTPHHHDIDKEKDTSELEATKATIMDHDQDVSAVTHRKLKRPRHARRPIILPIEYSKGEILHRIQMKHAETIHFNFACGKTYEEESEQDWEERMLRERMDHARQMEEHWRDSKSHKRHIGYFEGQEVFGGSRKRNRSDSLDVMSLQAAEFSQNARIIEEQEQLLGSKIRVIPCPKFSSPQELQQIHDLIRERRTYDPNIVKECDYPNPGSYGMRFLDQKYESITYRGILKAEDVVIENEYMKIVFFNPINLFRKEVENCIRMREGRLEIHDPNWKKAAFWVTFKNVEGFPAEEGEEREKFIRRVKQHNPFGSGGFCSIRKGRDISWFVSKEADRYARAAEKRKKLRRKEQKEKKRLQKLKREAERAIMKQYQEEGRSHELIDSEDESDSMYY